MYRCTYVCAGMCVCVVCVHTRNCFPSDLSSLMQVTMTVPGIECPRGKRQLPGGQTIESDPYGEDALLFTKEMCLQREVSLFFCLFMCFVYCLYICLFVGWLLNFQATCWVYLREGSTQTIVCAATLRSDLQIKLAISSSHSKLTLVLALTL